MELMQATTTLQQAAPTALEALAALNGNVGGAAMMHAIIQQLSATGL